MSDFSVIKFTSGGGTSCDTQEEAEQVARDESTVHSDAYVFTVEGDYDTGIIAIYINGVRYTADKQPE